jgi:hypothetical protein
VPDLRRGGNGNGIFREVGNMKKKTDGGRSWSLPHRIGFVILMLVPLLLYRQAPGAPVDDKPLTYDALAEQLHQVIATKAPYYPKEAVEGIVSAMVDPLREAKVRLVEADADRYVVALRDQMTADTFLDELVKPNSARYKYWTIDLRWRSGSVAAIPRPNPEQQAVMAAQREEILGLFDRWMAEGMPEVKGDELAAERKSFAERLEWAYRDPLRPGLKRPFTPGEMARLSGEIMTRDLEFLNRMRSPDPTPADIRFEIAAFEGMLISAASGLQEPRERPQEWKEAASLADKERDEEGKLLRERAEQRYRTHVVASATETERAWRNELLAVLEEVKRSLGVPANAGESSGKPSSLRFQCETRSDIPGGQPHAVFFDCSADRQDRLEIVISDRFSLHHGHRVDVIDFLSENVGYAIKLDACRSTILNDRRVRTIEWDLDRSVQLLPQPGSIEGPQSELVPYLADLMLCGQDTPKREERTLEDGSKEVETTYSRPWRVVEPHFIAKTRETTSADGLPLKSESIDADGKVVATTTYEDVQQAKSGLRRPMKSETVVAAGASPVAITVGVQNNGQPKHDEQWVADIPYAEKRIVRTYCWVADKHWLPLSTTIYEEGEPVMAITFKNYRVDGK